MYQVDWSVSGNEVLDDEVRTSDGLSTPPTKFCTVIFITEISAISYNSVCVRDRFFGMMWEKH